MSWEIIVLAVAATVAILLFVFKENPYVKKYWKYSLILLPALLIVAIKVINTRKETNKDKDITNSATALNVAISEIKEDLNEAKITAAVEVTAAKTKDAVKIEELKEVIAIKNKSERRKKLAALIG